MGVAPLHRFPAWEGKLCEFLAGGELLGLQKSLPCATNSGKYPYDVKVEEPPPGCKVFAFDREQQGNI